jgi:hypothetical protein
MSSRRTAVFHFALAASVMTVACGGPSAPPASSTPPPAAHTPAPQPQPDAAAAPATPSSSSAQQEWVKPPAITDADIPPLPVVPFAPARPMEVVRAVYVFAAKHPEVLSHVPCFCGCESRGHRHNDDCFVTSRDAQGRPTVWEPHGVG